MNEEWTWELSERAADGLDALDAETQQRILAKLDDVVSDDSANRRASPSR